MRWLAVLLALFFIAALMSASLAVGDPAPSPSQTLGPATTATPSPEPTWPSEVPTWTPEIPTAEAWPTVTASPVSLPVYVAAPNRISSGCTPAPAPVTPAQLYLASRVTPPEYCYAYHMIQYESHWNLADQKPPAEADRACGLGQAFPCSKMAYCAGYPPSTGCVPTPDWRTNYRGQIEWMLWWVYVATKPTAARRSFTEGGPYYGSFEEAACHEFGCWTSDRVLHLGQGWW